MIPRSIHPSRASGMTMLEVLIAAAVLAMLLGAVGNAVLRGGNACKQGLSNAMVEGQARRLLERVASEFASVDRSSLSPNPLAPVWSSTVRYQRCLGWEAGAMLLSPTRAVRLVLAQGELNNGIDDNGNGLVDECRVQLVPDMSTPTESFELGGSVREVAEGELANGLDDNANGLVDEAGLYFLHDGNGTLTVSLTLQRTDAAGRQITRTLRTAVRMRND